MVRKEVSQDNAYDISVAKEFAVKNKANAEFMHLDRIETYVKQQEADECSLVKIHDAFELGKIDAETRDTLIRYYTNTMYKYDHLYRVLESCLGAPKGLKFKNLETGELTEVVHENGKPVVYSKRCITPSTSVQIEFEDKYGKPLYLVLPGMKDAERAIEKVDKTGKYQEEYNRDLIKIRVKHALKSVGFVDDLKSFVDEARKNNKINLGMKKIDHKYKNIILCYMTELEAFLPNVDDKLGYMKNLYSISKRVADGANFLDTINDLETNIINKHQGAKEYLGKRLGKRSLLADYLTDLEGVVDISSRSDKKDVQDNYKGKLMDVYNYHLERDASYEKEISQVSKPYERIKDIFRCSIITRYYDNIAHMKEMLGDRLDAVSGKDKFFGNISPHHVGFKGDNKGYRDDKVVYRINKEDENGDSKYDVNFDVEVQFKLAGFVERDPESHDIYREQRKLEKDLAVCYDVDKRIFLEKEIYAKKYSIRKLYDECLSEYNRKVLETAAEMELSIFRKEWEKKDNETAKDLVRLQEFMSNREKDREEMLISGKTYPEVEKFLKDNLLVSPFKALVLENDIANIKEINYSEKINKPSSGKKFILNDDWVSKADMKSFAFRYYNIIKDKYICTINGNLDENVFKDYPEEEWIEEEKEFLQERNKKLANKNEKNNNVGAILQGLKHSKGMSS